MARLVSQEGGQQTSIGELQNRISELEADLSDARKASRAMDALLIRYADVRGGILTTVESWAYGDLTRAALLAMTKAHQCEGAAQE